jgi:hypothetical protein
MTSIKWQPASISSLLAVALAIALLVGACSYRVESDFSKVHVGMTEQEAVAQIGPPAQVREQGGARVLIYENYSRWLTNLSDQSLGRWDQQQMLIRLVNGKIESITSANRPDGGGQDYASSVLARPTPGTDQERVAECGWIRSEIARQQSAGQAGASIASAPAMGVAFQAAARKNIAALESRASNIQCTAAFSNTPAVRPGQPFDQCFARCQQYTDRTKNQCFDSCNH